MTNKKILLQVSLDLQKRRFFKKITHMVVSVNPEEQNIINSAVVVISTVIADERTVEQWSNGAVRRLWHLLISELIPMSSLTGLMMVLW